MAWGRGVEITRVLVDLSCLLQTSQQLQPADTQTGILNLSFPPAPAFLIQLFP